MIECEEKDDCEDYRKDGEYACECCPIDEIIRNVDEIRRRKQ